MPTKIEKDAITGTETTGHEWDGLKELNTPLPSWWLWTFYACIAWSLVYVILYPAIPLSGGATKGTLGWSQRTAIAQEMALARADQAVWRDQIAAKPLAEIAADPDLASFARAGGAAAFADNCAPCHGAGGAGRTGFPALGDDDWLWGGSLTAIDATIRYGVRSDHDDTRFSEMPSFAEVLTRDQSIAVAHHVLGLAKLDHDGDLARAGAPIYAEQCVSCHGVNGEGVRDQGGPRLADALWLYAGSFNDIVAQMRRPAHGQMPAWEGRLDGETLKMLAIYVHDLGGGE